MRRPVKLKKTKLILLVIMTFLSNEAFSITASEVFDNGKRAFDSCRWHEAEEFFGRFIKTWPDSKLVPQALHMQTTASTHTLEPRVQSFKDLITCQWQESLAKLSATMPKQDFTDLKVAIKIATERNFPTTWREFDDIAPVELHHYLRKNWHPDPHSTPLETLRWSSEWLAKNAAELSPDLQSRVYLLQIRALWQLLLSPMAISANASEIEAFGFMPVHTSFEKILIKGFSRACPDIKREIAMFGYHYDSLRRGMGKHQAFPLTSGKWYDYLHQRGFDTREAWCPK